MASLLCKEHLKIFKNQGITFRKNPYTYKNTIKFLPQINSLSVVSKVWIF